MIRSRLVAAPFGAAALRQNGEPLRRSSKRRSPGPTLLAASGVNLFLTGRRRDSRS
jgi:hypothetical protein